MLSISRERRFSSVEAPDGIGYGVATAFFEAGAEVAITGTRSADNYESDFGNFTYHQLDVRDPGAITALAGKFSELDVMANCIGSVLWKKKFERAGFEKIININLTGCYAALHGVLSAAVR